MNIPNGLSLQPDVISHEKELEIIKWIDQQEWSSDMSRRTQHYGYIYDYRSGNLIQGQSLEGPILELAKIFENKGLLKSDQCIVNEYNRNQGISSHVDNLKFGSVIIGVSLGSDGVLIFEKQKEKFECFLPRRSVMMMRDSARYDWKHSIDKKTTYTNSSGNTIIKPTDYRRISLTYRSINNNY